MRRTPEPIGQQARWQAFIEQFFLSSFIVLGRDIRMLTRSRGDLSWMIVSPVMNRVKTSFVELSQWVPESRPPDAPTGREEASVSTGESMAELQQSDTDIGPILR